MGKILNTQSGLGTLHNPAGESSVAKYSLATIEVSAGVATIKGIVEPHGFGDGYRLITSDGSRYKVMFVDQHGGVLATPER